jgi:hypothetical protein
MLKAEKILLGKHPIPCTIRNISEKGACLVFQTTAGVPAAFDFLMAGEPARTCKTVSRPRSRSCLFYGISEPLPLIAVPRNGTSQVVRPIKPNTIQTSITVQPNDSTVPRITTKSGHAPAKRRQREANCNERLCLGCTSVVSTLPSISVSAIVHQSRLAECVVRHKLWRRLALSHPSKLCGHLWRMRSAPLDQTCPEARNCLQPDGEEKMWAALLTVAALSLLISFALAAIATYLYFRSEKGGDVGHTGVPSIAPDDVVRFDLDEHDI